MPEPSNRPPDDDEPLPDLTPDGLSLHVHLAAPTVWAAYRTGLQTAVDRTESLLDEPPESSL
ncbi:hypothetical protein ACFYRN_40215 [Streptomyces sp. NPDC005227]|uniref:hypothetical protein n=1 Tax=Streptomyces sp. NPDC005227 TaxID=3364707 RepID=UPI003676ACDE